MNPALHMLAIAGLFSLSTLAVIRNVPMAILMALTALVLTAAVAFAEIRPVAAEDDCAQNTWSVTHLPLVGLVCIHEPA